MLRLLIGVFAFGALSGAAPLQAGCTREWLKEATDAYVAAQTAGSGTFATIGASSVYTENFKTMDLASSILKTALKIDHRKSLYDATKCASYSELIITDTRHPYVLGTQIFFTDGKVSKMETLVTDDGDWLFNAANTLKYASQEKWDEIPVADRDTREVIQAAADAYLDIFQDKSTKVPWGTPCQRLEGGAYTGRGSATDSCNVGIPDNVRLVNRRYVIDEVLGAVGVFLDFNGSLPDSHEFRVEKGKLRYIHTITVMGGSSGPGGGAGGGRPPGGGMGGGTRRPPRSTRISGPGLFRD